MSRALKELTIDWKVVGRRVRELRGFDTNQAELADAIGVAQSHISAIERGQKEPSATILLKIARRYGKTVDWLLTGAGDKIL
ncbi:MAG: helix-turn-helix transcriptional regulator [Silvibacterium sp.]